MSSLKNYIHWIEEIETQEDLPILNITTCELSQCRKPFIDDAHTDAVFELVHLL